MGKFWKSDRTPSQHLPWRGGLGAVLLVRKSLHGISPISDGRHSFGCGLKGDDDGGALGVGGQNIGGTHNMGGRIGRQGIIHHANGFATTSLLAEGAGALAGTASEGLGAAAVRTMARNKASCWDLDGAMEWNWFGLAGCEWWYYELVVCDQLIYWRMQVKYDALG
jgi:hypothetical protein